MERARCESSSTFMTSKNFGYQLPSSDMLYLLLLYLMLPLKDYFSTFLLVCKVLLGFMLLFIPRYLDLEQPSLFFSILHIFSSMPVLYNCMSYFDGFLAPFMLGKCLSVM